MDIRHWKVKNLIDQQVTNLDYNMQLWGWFIKISKTGKKFDCIEWNKQTRCTNYKKNGVIFM